MADSRRLVIILNHSVCSTRISRYLLFGRESRTRNGNKTLSIDSVAPLTENTFRNSATFHGKPCDDLKLVGCVFEDILVCDADLMEILADIFKTSLFYFVISPRQVLFGQSVLVIPLYIGAKPSRDTNIANVSNVIYTEITVVRLERNIRVPFYSLPNWNTLDNSTNDDGVMPKTFSSMNGFRRTSRVGNITANRVPKLFSLLLLSVLWVVEWIFSHGCAQSIQYFLGYAANFFFVAKQLLYRLDQVLDMVGKQKEKSQTAKMDSRSNCCGDKALLIIIDVFLGLMVVNFLFSNQNSLSMSTWIVGQKYTVADHLRNLLKWLMGVPAGLKLNKPLNQFLGNFYIYHVHLWTSYLYFIEAYLPSIIWMCSLSGCLGITFLLSVLCDVLTLLTLHIYCFYIYAARLYNLEVHALVSLLRLFTGKKWNILRCRVDSLEYDVDRLFIGTLLFTILLFLFPTIVLYYIVFTVLRLLVLIMQAALSGVVALLNSLPFWTIWLYFTNSESLPGYHDIGNNSFWNLFKRMKANVDVEWRMIVDTITMDSTAMFPDVECDKDVRIIQPDSVLFLSLKHQCSPLGNFFKDCFGTIVKATYCDVFGKEVFRKLLAGQLISNNKS